MEESKVVSSDQGQVPEKKKAHRIFNMQCISSVYTYLDEIEQIKMQALNRRHYNVIIPYMLSQLGCFN